MLGNLISVYFAPDGNHSGYNIPSHAQFSDRSSRTNHYFCIAVIVS